MPQKKLLGGAYSPQGDLANLRHSRTNERIGHISRPNLWNSNSTHISPKVISTTVCAICSFRLSSIATHDSSSQCTCPSSWTSTSSSPSCPALSPATARPAPGVLSCFAYPTSFRPLAIHFCARRPEMHRPLTQSGQPATIPMRMLFINSSFSFYPKFIDFGRIHRNRRSGR